LANKGEQQQQQCLIHSLHPSNIDKKIEGKQQQIQNYNSNRTTTTETVVGSDNEER